MKTTTKHLLSVGFAVASAITTYTPSAKAQSPRDDDWRGTVVVRGKGLRAVTTGPAVVHAYSAFSGGAMFVVPSVAGSDADCVTAFTSSTRPPSPLIADRVALISVGPGEIACLATDTERAFELLWHAFPVNSAPTLIADVRK
jgi:hypothetical protein